MQSDAQHPIRLYWSVKGGTGTSTVAAATAIRLANEGQDVVLVDLEGDQPALLGMISGASDDENGLGDWLGSERRDASLASLCEEVAPGMNLLRRGNHMDAQAPSDIAEALRTLSRTAHVVVDGGLDQAPSDIAEALRTLSRTAHVVVDGGLDRDNIRSQIAEPPNEPVCVMRACYLALSRAQRVPGPYDRVVLVEEPGRSLRARDIEAALGAEHAERIAWDLRIARAVDAGTIVSMLPPPLRRFDINLGKADDSANFDASGLHAVASQRQAEPGECGAETASGGRCTQQISPGAQQCRAGHAVSR